MSGLIARNSFRLLFGVALLLSAFIKSEGISLSEEVFFWPTPNESFSQGKPDETFIQPSSSGKLKSGRFGCVRNDGARFHEGIDLKPVKRTRNGEAADSIYAFASGQVVFINEKAGNSSYGRYIVIEHSNAPLPFYSLYAHLASINPEIKTGVWLKGQTVLGKMGRSANHRIPKSRAHLHFEVGFRLSDNFSSWWASQSFKERNRFGNYHGWNLVGIDPLEFFTQLRAGSIETFQAYVERLPTAYTLRARTQKIPFFIRQYPGLLSRPIPYEEIQGWEIDYSAYGLPKRWTPLRREDFHFINTPGEVAVIYYDPVLLQKNTCQPMIEKDKKTGALSLSKKARNQLEVIFGFRSIQ